MKQRCQGFSLIEVMVVVAIMGVITAQMFVVFTTQKRTYLSNDNALEIQEDARLITDLIAFDTRQAGFMLPPNATVASFDGQMGGGVPDQPYRLCVSDPSFFSVPDYGQDSDDFDARDGGWPGSNVVMLLANGAQLDTLLVDPDATADFFVGGGIILATDTTSYCARIQSILPGNIVLFPDPIPGPIAAALPAATAVPAVIYEIDETNPAQPFMMRNGAPLADQVEDMQVEFWIDDEQSGTQGQIDANEWPIYSLSGMLPQFQTGEIERVRVSVITRSPQAEQQDGQNFTFHMRPAAGNRAEGAVQDNFRRRRFTASITPRNAF